MTATQDSIRKDLEPIYNEMRERNRNSILDSQTMNEDDYLGDQKDRTDDDRRCLAISAVISKNCDFTTAYEELQALLQKEFPEDLHFGHEVSPERNVHGQLHWTVMQLVGFSDYDKECVGSVGTESTADDSVTSCSTSSSTSQGAGVYEQQDYLDCIQDSLNVGGMDSNVEIHYVGVIAVATGLLMIGIPSVDMNDIRDRLRQRISQRGLPLKEPFVNNICHSTLFRVMKNTPSKYERLLEIAKAYENVDLGKVTLRKFQIGPASWRMLQLEVVDTPPLRSWKMNPTTASQAYLGRIHEIRNEQTLSGATGEDLARELRRSNTSKPRTTNNFKSGVLQERKRNSKRRAEKSHF